ncbi:MAG TPA: hypothetical protein VGB18_07570 [Candidatus Thermoplasmatota archaeon]
MTPRGSRSAGDGPEGAVRHWKKAGRFLAAARHDRDGRHWEAAISSAVLGGIHLADALSLWYTGRRSATQRHEDATDRIEGIVEIDAPVRRRFADHVRALLEVKNLVQYSGDESRATDADEAITHLERALAAVAPIAKGAGWLGP